MEDSVRLGESPWERFTEDRDVLGVLHGVEDFLQRSASGESTSIGSSVDCEAREGLADDFLFELARGEFMMTVESLADFRGEIVLGVDLHTGGFRFDILGVRVGLGVSLS